MNNSKTYCVLPFNHINIHPNGHSSICCVSGMKWPNDGFYKDNSGNLKNIKDYTISNIFEDSSVNKIRKELLNNEIPPACRGCFEIEKNGGISRRLLENKRWKHKSKPNLEFIDLRISNTCNSKCMMCFPDSSTALTSDYSKWAKECSFIKQLNEFNKPKYYQWFNEDVIEQILVYKKSLKYLYINGGEPFIMDLQWKFLQRLIEEDVAKNIIISYNTNCTTYKEEFNEYWKHFKEVRIGLSVDAIGLKNKFIRYPTDWELVNENVNKFIENNYIRHINITCTIQWLNAPFLDEFYNWAVPLISKKRGYSINQNFIVFPDFLSLNIAPISFKERLKKEFEKSKYQKRILTPTMLSYLNNDYSEEKYNQGLKFLDSVSKTRNMKWRDIFNYEF